MAIEYRVSWTMWPHLWPESSRTDRVTSDEESARQQYAGLLSLLADHELRPCDKHIWDPKLEQRTVTQGSWTPV